ncbi:hypothetical protein SAMN05443432_1199 [Roseovarius litoreus]|uniref:Uncharacterized protein n=1 Tax=Roseovarius litoreus TaxID=1155722 RepID=A0A1M7LNM4_9RHOB|nr:hypothetical protein SAMN05443432_1199 [Roseovarius litoreus]
MTCRGGIEIIPGWDREHAFAVMIRDRHRDSGYLARALPTRQRAIDFAEGLAEASTPRLHCADVLALRGGAA